MHKSKSLKSILMLSSNPRGTRNLRLDEEEEKIKTRLRLAGYGKVPIHSHGATSPIDMQQALLDFRPQIVHFSGHGAGQDGLVLETSTGEEQLVSGDALATLFKLFANNVECVVLNACYAEFQAKAISKHIKYVIGMSKNIDDAAAIEFSVGFYTALGAGEDIEFAYQLGCNTLQLRGMPGYTTPVLYVSGKCVSMDPPSPRSFHSPYPTAPPEKPEPISEDSLNIALSNSLSNWTKVVSPLPEDAAKVRVELFRQFRFKTFLGAVEFMHQVAPGCEIALHHPRWENIWRTVNVYLTTWDIGHRISDRDIQLAKYLDKAFSEFPSAA